MSWADAGDWQTRSPSAVTRPVTLAFGKSKKHRMRLVSTKFSPWITTRVSPETGPELGEESLSTTGAA